MDSKANFYTPSPECIIATFDSYLLILYHIYHIERCKYKYKNKSYPGSMIYYVSYQFFFFINSTLLPLMRICLNSSTF